MKLAITLVLATLVTGVASRQASPPVEQDRHGGWDQESAARYLDDRMDAWFANAKKLRTGEAQTACVSCHTTVPYVLSRPVLRRAMLVSTATAHEARIIDEATRRVETYGTHQLLYETNEGKKTESRGTEAVLNALILANADAGQDRREPSEATRKALARLWEMQRPDGAWDWLDFGLEPFETVDGAYFGATLAALAVGTAPHSPNGEAAPATSGIDKLRGYLKERYASQRLFNRSWVLLASIRLNDLLTAAERQALIADIPSRQRPDGGWSLESLGTWRWDKTAAPFQAPGTTDASLLGRSDGYATGLIVYTLRQAGLTIKDPAVSKGLAWLEANQRPVQIDQQTWTAWRAHSLNFDREHGGDKGESWRRLFMSDAATAFAVLALVGSD